LAFLFDVVLAALQAAVDQQADILAGGLGLFPVALTSGFVLVVGVHDGGFVLGALIVTRRRWHFCDFLQAREFALDISIANDVLGGGQNGIGLGLFLGVGWVVAVTDASFDGIDFGAILIPFFRMQSGHDWITVAFGQLFAEFASFGQHLREPFAVFVLHHAPTRATVPHGRDVSFETVFRHGESRTRHSQNDQDQLHG